MLNSKNSKRIPLKVSLTQLLDDPEFIWEDVVFDLTEKEFNDKMEQEALTGDSYLWFGRYIAHRRYVNGEEKGSWLIRRIDA